MSSEQDANLNYVRLDVGHQFFTCHKDTILASGNSILSKLVSPEFDNRKSNTDYIVIDRDGKHFGLILNYLRDPRSLNLKSLTDMELEELNREADYYCILDLLTLCETETESRFTNSLQSLELDDKQFIVPENEKLEIIYNHNTMLRLMSSSRRRVIVLSHKSLKRFHIESWFEKLIRFQCDYSKNVVYSYAAPDGDGHSFKDFIVFFYNPVEDRIVYTIRAPDEAKFKSNRMKYKTRIYKHWYINQYDLKIDSRPYNSNLEQK